MVMGLFVISAVLAPITSLLHTPLSMEIPAWSDAAPQDLPVIAEGQGVKVGRDAVQEQYRKILVNQIQALALSTKGVESALVDIKFEEGAGGVIDQPKISEVNVTLTASKEEIEPVQPITIGPKPLDQKQSPKSDEVRDKISVFMSLSKDAIHVQER